MYEASDMAKAAQDYRHHTATAISVAEGFVPSGRTNMDEFAIKFVRQHSVYGVCKTLRH